MPGRQSHGGASSNKQSKKPRTKNNSKRRALDAFAIASHENPDFLKVRQTRLGAQEGGNGKAKKRRRDEDEDEDEEEELSTKKQKKGPAKGKFDELDVDEGSDSEGNEWKLGQVDSDDDSDLDSDEAFGESDEERFEGYAFSGSSKVKPLKSKSRSQEVNLNETDDEDSDSELEEGDLGEGAVDLATILDMAEAEETEETQTRKPKKIQDESQSDEDMEDGEESEDDSSVSSADDDETADPEKIASIQNLIANLPQADESRHPAKQRSDGASEYKTESGFGLTSIDDVDYLLEDDNNGYKSKKITGKLQVPLAKRQQDRLDRSAAYDKSKETLERWTDTVKHNRRADHLIFPLPDADVASSKNNKELYPTNLTKPFNELEATIQSILEESGLATANGKDDEDKIREFEELQTNKLSFSEVKARTEQLRAARELLFREEAKAKRIKKIKSKSYRKVHRRQREKEERLEAEALAEGGYVPSEDELEARDRRRAEERMGSKHRDSKWAKAMKGTGRAAWDEDVRSGVTEMARRDEELRKRVEGKALGKALENDSDQSMSDSDLNENDEADERKRLLQKLKKVGESDLLDELLPGAKLANMDFMRKAEATRRKANDAMVEEIRRDLAGEDSLDEDEEEQGDVGRRTFGPGRNSDQPKKNHKNLNEFEESLGSDDEDDDAAHLRVQQSNDNKEVTSISGKKQPKSILKRLNQGLKSQPVPHSEGGAWSKVVSKSTTVNDAEAKRRRHKKDNAVDVEELDLSQATVIATQPKPKKQVKKPSKKTKKSSTLEIDSESEESENGNAVPYLPFALRDQALIKRAFAGADVVGEFRKEKEKIVKDQEDKIVDDTLPGWGNWIGNGVSAKEKRRSKGKVLRKVDGVAKDKRKDAKLSRAIINEKKVKKNGKYLASTLPHPFESKQQYERSLRLPIGPEWNTKETFQDATKPRLLVKQGIIAPMSKPLV